MSRFPLVQGDGKLDRPFSSSRTDKKRFRRVAIFLIVALGAFTLLVQFGLGFVIRHGASSAGQRFLGTDVQVATASVSPLVGIADLGGIVVGPPKGFKANVFEMNNFRISVDMKSLLSDTIIIKEIAIINPTVSYELSGVKSNIRAITDKLSGDEKKAEKKTDEASGKKVIIEEFLFTGASIRIASTATGGKGVVIPMGPIRLTDIGKKSGGTTSVDAVTQAMGAIGTGVLKTVSDSTFAIAGTAVQGVATVGVAAVKGVAAVGGAAVQGVTSVGSAAVKGVSAVGGAAIEGVTSVGGAALGGVKTIGGAAVGGVTAVGGAAFGGAKALGGAVTGIFTSNAKTNTPPAQTPKTK